MRLQTELGRWLLLLQREQGLRHVGVESGTGKGPRLAVGTAGGVPKVVFFWHMHPAMPPCWCGDGEGALGGAGSSSWPGHLPGVLSWIFPPWSNAAERGVPVVLCGVLARDGAAGMVSRRGRTDGRTCCSPSALRVSPGAASLPCSHPAGACLFPASLLASLCVLWRDQSIPRCPWLSPALPDHRSRPAGAGCAVSGAAGQLPGPCVWILSVLGCENPVDFLGHPFLPSVGLLGCASLCCESGAGWRRLGAGKTWVSPKPWEPPEAPALSGWGDVCRNVVPPSPEVVLKGQAVPVPSRGPARRQWGG